MYAAGASNTITGLSHLEGESVVAWGGGLYLGTFTVSGGSITLHASTTYTHRCAGLGYQGRFKSAKLAYSIPQRAEIGRRKRIDKVGFVLLDTHPQGIEYGPDFDTLDPLPERDRGADVSQTTIMSEYDSDPIWFPGRWDNDSRLCLVANAPKPATILAALIHIEQN